MNYVDTSYTICNMHIIYAYMQAMWGCMIMCMAGVCTRVFTVAAVELTLLC